jgi:NADPH-dependent glutamate synthase beta subunit-like oxidoreductase
VISAGVRFGFDIDKITPTTPREQAVFNIYGFIKENIDEPDFDIALIAYRKYQNDLLYLKAYRKELDKYKDKRIVVWGAGKRGVRDMNTLRNLGVEFELTDGDERKHGTKIHDLAVVKPWSELRERADVVFVSVVGRFEEIRERILRDSPALEVREFDKVAARDFV